MNSNDPPRVNTNNTQRALSNESEEEPSSPARNLVNSLSESSPARNLVNSLSETNELANCMATVVARSSSTTPVLPITSNNGVATQFSSNSQWGGTKDTIRYTPLSNQAIMDNPEKIIKSNGMLLESLLVQQAKIQSLQNTYQELGHINSLLLESKKQLVVQNTLKKGALQQQFLNAQQQNTGGIFPLISQGNWQLRRTAFISTASNSSRIANIDSDNYLSNSSRLQSRHQPMEILPTMCPLLSLTPSNIRQLNSPQRQHMDNQPMFQAESPQQENFKDTKPKGRPSVFPKRLYQMLCDLEEQPGGTEIASFLPHGRAFAIYKPKQFIEQVIPYYLHLTSIDSFNRQLRMYNFQNISVGPDKGAYYHELFIRGQPILCCGIKRREKESNQEKKSEHS